jgi:hypothetical protein
MLREAGFHPRSSLVKPEGRLSLDCALNETVRHRRARASVCIRPDGPVGKEISKRIHALPAQLESMRLNINHAGHRFDGAGDLRRHFEAARQSYLDLATAREQQNDRNLAVAFGFQALGEAFDGCGIT